MDKVFVDTDICIDLLSKRQPFNKAAELLFSLADTGKLNYVFHHFHFQILIMFYFPNILQLIRDR
jgi:predicted nucleic acid-binding protein